MRLDPTSILPTALVDPLEKIPEKGIIPPAEEYLK